MCVEKWSLEFLQDLLGVPGLRLCAWDKVGKDPQIPISIMLNQKIILKRWENSDIFRIQALTTKIVTVPFPISFPQLLIQNKLKFLLKNRVNPPKISGAVWEIFAL